MKKTTRKTSKKSNKKDNSVSYFISESQRRGVDRVSLIFGNKRTFALLVLLVVGSGLAGIAILQKTRDSQAASLGMQYGIVTGGDTTGGTNDAASLGIHMARFYEKDRNAAASDWDSEVLNAVKQGVEPLILIDDDSMATSESAGNVGAIASRFGPGGVFWQNGQPGSGYGQYAPRWMEWGNEENLNYKNVIGNGAIYGRSARAAAQAIKASNPNMGLIVQGEDTDQGLSSGQTPWFQAMFSAAPELKTLAAGWTIHPYGPNADKMDKMNSLLVSNGISNPQIFITEDGISTDDGNNLSGNYNWPTNMTYAQAATAIQQKVSLIKAKSYSSNIRTYMQYQARDQKTPGYADSSGKRDREWFFGITKNDGSDKGNYTSVVRTLASQNPRDGSSATTTPTPSPTPSPTPTPTPTPSPTPAPTGNYNFTVSGTTMKWSSVPNATAYKVYLADTNTYIDLTSTDTSYVVPPPASGTQRTVGWTWYDGQDHWVAQQVVNFTAPTPTPTPTPTPSPTPAPNPAPTPSYNFSVVGQTMNWAQVPNSTGYKIYLADTQTYLDIASGVTSYTVPPPASGTQRTVGWTWYDGQDHWVAQQVVNFSGPTQIPALTLLDAENSTNCVKDGVSVNCTSMLLADSLAIGGNAVKLGYNKDSVTQSFGITKAGTYRLGYTLKSQSYRGDATVDIFLDNVKTAKGVKVSKANYTYYYIEKALQPGSHTLKVVFTNDKCGNTLPAEKCDASHDRNLFVDQWKMSGL